jgi:hypothetical protein
MPEQEHSPVHRLDLQRQRQGIVGNTVLLSYLYPVRAMLLYFSHSDSRNAENTHSSQAKHYYHQQRPAEAD